MLFFENLRRQMPFWRVMESAFGGFRIKYEENMHHLKGEYLITLRDAKTGRVLDQRHGHNLIVNSASILIARLLKDSSDPDAGISYLAVGTGAVGWNLQNPPQPTVSQITLNSEITRKAFSTPDVVFIDPDSGEPVSYATGVVDFTVTFAETEAVGPLVEMSLFGGDASDSPNTGTMVNYRTFPVINKTNSMNLTITFRITA